MEYHRVLDTLLEGFWRNTGGAHPYIFNQLVPDDWLRMAAVEYLRELGMVVDRTINQEGRYTITFEGRLFMEEGGFVKELRRRRWNARWPVIRNVATVLYSLAVLAVAVWAVVVELS